MGWALSDLSRVHGAAASATEIKVNSVSLVRSRGSFGCETRPWSTSEIEHLQSFENTALLMLTGRKRYQLRMYGTRLSQLRCQFRVEPLESFIRYMQASEIGHFVRAPSWRISREALFGVFTLPGLGDVERRWLSEHRRGRESSTLWDQAKATVELSTGPISDELMVALARSRQLWTRVVLESRVSLTMRDYESANAGRAEAGKRLLLTAEDLRLAQVFWTSHFGTKLGFSLSDTFSSFREWCTFSPGSQPVFHATEEGTLLKRLYEESVVASSKFTCRGEGCSFCVEAPAGESLSDDRFSFNYTGYDCIPCPTVGSDAFASHPCTVLEAHERDCPAAQAAALTEQERWHVAEGIPDLREEVRAKLHGLADLPGTLGHLYRAVGAKRLDSILDAEAAPQALASSPDRFRDSLAADHHKIVREVQLFEHFEFTQSGDSAIAENAGRFDRRYNPTLSEAERRAAPRLTGIFCKCPRCFTPAEEFDLYDLDVRGHRLANLRVAFLHMREIKQAAAAGQLAPLVTEAMQKKEKLEPPAVALPDPPAVADDVAAARAGPEAPPRPPAPVLGAADVGPGLQKKRLVGRDGVLIDLPVGHTATGRGSDRILVSVPAHAFSRTINPSTFDTDAGAVQAATRLRAQVIRDPLAFSRRARGSL
eukprot:g13266.t1